MTGEGAEKEEDVERATGGSQVQHRSQAFQVGPIIYLKLTLLLWKISSFQVVAQNNMSSSDC